MEFETMSSAFAGLKTHTSDDDGAARPAGGTRGAATGKEPICSKAGANARRRERQLFRDSIKAGRRPPRRGDEEEEGAIPVYRRAWETSFGGVFGSFDDETALGPMRYTSGPIPENAVPASTLQIFSVRVTDLKGLWWPLHVYGLVATRDEADHNRNFLFRRTRDNCQILTKEDPVLLLTGPSRAVLLAGLVTFEVQLMVKSKTELADKVLASKVFYFHQGSRREDSICTRIPYKHCALEFALAPLRHSVEATVSVQLVDGSWPDGHQGLVFSCTDSIKDTKMVLLDCRDGNMPIGSDGMFELSRCVVCAELGGRDKLMVSVQARRVGFLTRNAAVFEPKMSGTSVGMCDLRFCKMQVTVAWSLLSTSGTHADAGGK
ncbi:uncharacterized protein LOC119368838 [Triticum dicoccoides]|uniref:DUF6598 domain-containing protein n=1 Tax=Triticum turgidum subsp. durum TaxID=4567 RepID=A0A9R1Q5A6_TRITD|nr:uncharacterized protein LOC119368838 [Triticum dicoccoides]VAH54295.1 unnamed protein product [Triticum turgidum subsp. durum]